MSNDFDEQELFTPEELEAMGMASSADEPADEDLGAKINDLQEQLAVLAGFIAEGADREAALRCSIHEMQEELKAAENFQDVAFKIQDLERHVDAMAQSAAEAQKNEEVIRVVLSEVRNKLPLVRVPRHKSG